MDNRNPWQCDRRQRCSPDSATLPSHARCCQSTSAARGRADLFANAWRTNLGALENLFQCVPACTETRRRHARNIILNLGVDQARRQTLAYRWRAKFPRACQPATASRSGGFHRGRPHPMDAQKLPRQVLPRPRKTPRTRRCPSPRHSHWFQFARQENQVALHSVQVRALQAWRLAWALLLVQ